jgi:alkaline phosphatase
LQYNRKGYILVVDCALPGKAASQNEGERMLRELLALDDAVKAAQATAGENALILVAGKQSIGGMRLNGYPFRNDKGVAVVGINAQGVPSITWSTGPGSQHPSAETGVTASSEPSAFSAPAAVGVAEDGLILGSGVGSEKLQGFRDNTDIFRVLSENL